jgi:hypothetical protein
VADFISARAAGEPRLTAAIVVRAEHPRRTAEEAAMLDVLLLSHPADPTKERNKPVELTRALMGALVANGTAMADNSLLGVLAGDLLAPDDQTALEAALIALVRLARVETEQVVVRAILAPQEVRPAGHGQVTAEGLQKAALAAVRAGSSSRLRLRLAAAAIDPQQPGNLRTLVQGLLSEAVAENLEAMAMLYGSTAIDAATRATIETYLANCSSQLVGRLLRIPEATGAAAALAEVKPSSRLTVLWNAELGAAVNRQLELLESLPSQPRLILLAATMPTGAVRPVLYEALRRNWEDGPKAFTTIMSAPQAWWEPGFFVSIKLLHPSLTETADHIAKVKSRLTKHKPVRPPLPGAKDENQLRFDWLRMQYSLLIALCQRLNVAGQAQQGMAQNPLAAGDAEPPIPLHEGARVVTRFDLDWPKGLPAGVPENNVAATTVKYVRIQQTTTRLKAIVGYYRHQLDSPAEHPLQDGLTLWLESCKRLPDSDRCRSLDVVITRGKKVHETHDSEDKITVDVLLVEVNDPSRTQAKE